MTAAREIEAAGTGIAATLDSFGKLGVTYASMIGVLVAFFFVVRVLLSLVKEHRQHLEKTHSMHDSHIEQKDKLFSERIDRKESEHRKQINDLIESHNRHRSEDAKLVADAIKEAMQK